MSVAERLARNVYVTDEEVSHIEVNQEKCKGAVGDLLIRVCPAQVYAREPDGAISVEYAACLECGTCLAVAPAGTLSWSYPRSGMGIQFREG